MRPANGMIASKADTRIHTGAAPPSSNAKVTGAKASSQ
jgi:hypothetical protein